MWAGYTREEFKIESSFNRFLFINSGLNDFNAAELLKIIFDKINVCTVYAWFKITY